MTEFLSVKQGEVPDYGEHEDHGKHDDVKPGRADVERILLSPHVPHGKRNAVPQKVSEVEKNQRVQGERTSSLLRATMARVSPHPGHCSPVMRLNIQGIPVPKCRVASR